PAGVIPREEDGSGEEPADHEGQPCAEIGHPAHEPESWEENATHKCEGEDIADQRQEPEGRDRIFALGDEEDGHWDRNDERCEEEGSPRKGNRVLRHDLPERFNKDKPFLRRTTIFVWPARSFPFAYKPIPMDPFRESLLVIRKCAIVSPITSS